MTPKTAGEPSPELIFETFNAYQRTAALRTAIELDVFRAVGEGLGDAVSLARQCGASARGIRILCDYLTIVGLLAKQDGHYRHTPTSALFLDPRSPACMASAARFLGTPALAEPFARLTDVVRSGHTVLPGDGTVEPENPIWVEFAHGMAPMMGALAGPLGAIVLDGLAGPLRVLDIAAGHGLFGIEVAKLNPEAEITALDWAAVLEFVPNEDRVSPPVAAAFSMTMLANTAGGDAYTFRELEEMYREAGYGGVTAHVIPRSAHTVVMGRA